MINPENLKNIIKMDLKSLDPCDCVGSIPTPGTKNIKGLAEQAAPYFFRLWRLAVVLQ